MTMTRTRLDTAGRLTTGQYQVPGVQPTDPAVDTMRQASSRATHDHTRHRISWLFRRLVGLGVADPASMHLDALAMEML